MEAKKSHDLRYATWRTRKANNVCWRPENLVANGIRLDQSPKAQQPGAPMSKGRRQWSSLLRKEQIHPPLSFVPSWPQQIGWCSHVEVRAICFTQSTNSNANLIWKQPYRCPEIMFTSYWISVGSVKLTLKINHHKRWGHTRGRCELHHAFTLMLSDEFRAIYSISLVAQVVKDRPAMQETGVWSLGQEDPLEKEMATHSSILAWRIPWTEEPGSLQSMGLQRARHDWTTIF